MRMVPVMMKLFHPSQDGASFTTTNTIGFTAGGYYASSSNNSWHTNLGTNGFFRSAVNMGNARMRYLVDRLEFNSPFDSAKNTVAGTHIE